MISVRQMGYIVFGTPDVEASAKDISGIVGLEITERKPGAIVLSSNSKSLEVAYVENARRGVRAIGLQVADASAVDTIRRRVASEGFDLLDDKPLIDKSQRAIRFATPFGPIFEVHTPVAARTVTAGHDQLVRGLDHVNLRVSDPRAFHDFVVDVLGMSLSDRTSNFERAWYRAADGRHHTIAAAPGSGIHHFGFDALAVESLIKVADKLVTTGRNLLWGIGRHGPGNNIFSYYIDPNGCVIENSFGMVSIAAEGYTAGVWEFGAGNNVLDLWGSQPPPAYAKALTPFIQ
jgi:catechol 2,3-dioxygenase